MTPYDGKLNPNEIYNVLFNMIISIQTFADDIKHNNSALVNRARVDGSMYGDTKLYVGVDILKVHDWLNDAEAANLLELDRGPAPKTQSITINQFKQIRLTEDKYLSKRAWGTEGAFSQFITVLLSRIRTTKDAYDSTLYNTYIGTTESEGAAQQVTIALGAEPTGEAETEAYNRLYAQTVATEVADLFDALEDYSTEYNDWGFTRAYSRDDLIVVWNKEIYNKIRKVDLPTIFHNDNLIEKFGEYSLPARYFGNINTAGGTAPASNNSIRALKEGVFGGVSIKAGDLLPGNATYNANETYTVDPTIAFKIIHKDSVPYMSAFEVGTTFFNPRSLTETHYLTWGHNTLDYLREYPLITAKITQA